jgi:hypothetical protein
MSDCSAKGRAHFGDQHGMRKHPERVPRGEKHVNAKLKETEVVEIRSLYASGLWFQREIAAKFGIRPGAVCSIVNRKNWKHLL